MGKEINQYKTYGDQEITKEILDSIEVGDYIKVNNWKRPLIVKAVSKNYFIMSIPCFGNWLYSICDKNFKLCGPDDMIFGSKYNYSKESECEIAIVELEKGLLELSYRRDMEINKIQIKKMKPKVERTEVLDELTKLVEKDENHLEYWNKYNKDEKLKECGFRLAEESLKIKREALENYKKKVIYESRIN